MRHALAAVLVPLCVFVPGFAGATGSALETANAVLASIRAEEFGQAASRFRYPDSFSVEERRTDEAAIASSLKSLFKITGPFKEAPLPETGAFTTYKFTIRAGDAAHPLPKPDAMKSAAYRFSAPLENYPDGRVSIELDSESGNWTVRSLSFGLAASDPSSLTRIKRLFEQMRAERTARDRGAPREGAAAAVD